MNAAGDYAYDYMDCSSVEYTTDAGDKGTAELSQEGPGTLTGSITVSGNAKQLWCYSEGAQALQVPLRVSKNDPVTSAALSGMAFSAGPVSLTGKDRVSGSIKPLTSAVVLDIVDSRGKWSGTPVSSVTLSADGEDVLTFDCSRLPLGTKDAPLSLGAAVLPRSFTGTITVTGEGLTAVLTVSSELVFQAGYIKHITVDLASANVNGQTAKGFPKRLGIMGDSISTFEGIIPADHRKYYPAGDVDDWTKTYWGVLAKEYWKCELDVNTSWSGSSVASGKAGSVRTPFVDRCNLFKDPDTIILFGGTNDAIPDNSIALGEFSYDTPLGMMNHYRRFRDAYIFVIRTLQEKFPDAQIICIIGTHVTGEYGASVEAIAKHYNLPYVDFRGDAKVTLYSGSHPNAAGHAYKAKKIYEQTLNLFQ